MASSILRIDGGVGTELIRRGVTCPAPLWSGAGLFRPEVLTDIYVDYLHAGAQALTTNTFRTGWSDIAQAQLPPEAFVELNRRAIEIVQNAIQQGGQGREIQILGSMSSVADCYRPEEVPTDLTYLEGIHWHQWELLTHDPRVQVILAETMGSAKELKTLLRLRDKTKSHRKPLWVSLLCRDAQTLWDETPLAQVWQMCEQLGWPEVIGFNCVSPAHITQLIECQRDPCLSSGSQLLAYGHLGKRDTQGRWVHADVMTPDQYADIVMRWVYLGVSIVGGCCGTTPEHIHAVTRKLLERDKAP